MGREHGAGRQGDKLACLDPSRETSRRAEPYPAPPLHLPLHLPSVTTCSGLHAGRQVRTSAEDLDRFPPPATTTSGSASPSCCRTWMRTRAGLLAVRHRVEGRLLVDAIQTEARAMTAAVYDGLPRPLRGSGRRHAPARTPGGSRPPRAHRSRRTTVGGGGDPHRPPGAQTRPSGRGATRRGAACTATGRSSRSTPTSPAGRGNPRAKPAGDLLRRGPLGQVDPRPSCPGGAGRRQRWPVSWTRVSLVLASNCGPSEPCSRPSGAGEAGVP